MAPAVAAPKGLGPGAPALMAWGRFRGRERWMPPWGSRGLGGRAWISGGLMVEDRCPMIDSLPFLIKV